MGDMPVEQPAEQWFELQDAPLDCDSVHRFRNLGCPQYSICLDAALIAIQRQGQEQVDCTAPRRRRRRRQTWRLSPSQESRSKTWICRRDCPNLDEKTLFHMELMQSAPRE